MKIFTTIFYTTLHEKIKKGAKMFFRKKKSPENTTEIIKYLEEFRLDVNNRIQELKSLVQENKHSINELDNKLFSKDLKDKQMYGMLHYKIHEVKPSGSNS